jgi:hypothetical protein
MVDVNMKMIDQNIEQNNSDNQIKKVRNDLKKKVFSQEVDDTYKRFTTKIYEPIYKILNITLDKNKAFSSFLTNKNFTVKNEGKIILLEDLNIFYEFFKENGILKQFTKEDFQDSCLNLCFEHLQKASKDFISTHQEKLDEKLLKTEFFITQYQKKIELELLNGENNQKPKKKNAQKKKKKKKEIYLDEATTFLLKPINNNNNDSLDEYDDNDNQSMLSFQTNQTNQTTGTQFDIFNTQQEISTMMFDFAEQKKNQIQNLQKKINNTLLQQEKNKLKDTLKNLIEKYIIDQETLKEIDSLWNNNEQSLIEEGSLKELNSKLQSFFSIITNINNKFQEQQEKTNQIIEEQKKEIKDAKKKGKDLTQGEIQQERQSLLKKQIKALKMKYKQIDDEINTIEKKIDQAEKKNNSVDEQPTRITCHETSFFNILETIMKSNAENKSHLIYKCFKFAHTATTKGLGQHVSKFKMHPIVKKGQNLFAIKPGNENQIVLFELFEMSENKTIKFIDFGGHEIYEKN